jgi:hypothetical protein
MTRTKGNVIVENIKIGDIHWEFDYGCSIKSEVVSLPTPEKRDDDTYWTWTSRNLRNGEIIDYGVSDKYAHYGPNLYDYEAYSGCKQI